MGQPETATVVEGRRGALRALFRERGHALTKNPKNVYIEFEVRTDGRSIFTLYTSGKLVTTVRDGDAEGLVLADEVRRLLGVEPAAPGTSAAKTTRGERGLQRGTRPGLHWLGGADETGTGEILGMAMLGGALLAPALADELFALVGSVETKTSRAASGWARLEAGLADLRTRGLVTTVLPIPNRLFDRYNKNALLDLAYLRLVGDLLAAAGRRRADDLDDVELAIDDYGAGGLLRLAVDAWQVRGAEVVLTTRADDRHLAARAASVAARSARSREMEGLAAEATDGPLGTGNPGHPDTRRWLVAHARGGEPWPAFVKASFRTVSDLTGGEPATKCPVPTPDELLDDEGSESLVGGWLDVRDARLRLDKRRTTNRFEVDVHGHLLGHDRPCLAHEFLPVLCGGLVLDLAELPLELLDRMLAREDGLLSGWRVLVGPRQDEVDPLLAALAAAHARGVLQLVPTQEHDPRERAHAAGAVRLTDVDAGDDWRLVLRP